MFWLFLLLITLQWIYSRNHLSFYNTTTIFIYYIFIRINSSLRKLPSETASLLLRAFPIFILSSRGQLSTCKRDTAVRMLLHPQIDHLWALQYTCKRYHAHRLHFTCGIYELSICFLDLKFYDILLYSILRQLTLLNFTFHHFSFHILFSLSFTTSSAFHSNDYSLLIHFSGLNT